MGRVVFAFPCALLLMAGCGQKNSAAKSTVTSLSLKAHKDLSVVGFSFGENNKSWAPLRNLTVKFSAPLDPQTVDAQSVRVVREDTGEIVPGELRVSGNTLEFRPRTQFYFLDNEDGKPNGTHWYGLKPKAAYHLVLSETLTDTDGHSLDGDISRRFVTPRLDHGIYWLGDQGDAAKAYAHEPNPYFDPSKPVVIYVHGWQNTTSQNDYRRENAFYFNTTELPHSNMAALWRSRGFNVGLFTWAQWADEPEVKDAEAKVWATGPVGQKSWDEVLRYRTSDGSYLPAADTRNVTDVFFDDYVQSLKGYAGGNIRLIGHSLGNQVVTALAHKVQEAVESKRVDRALLPHRLVLLDPFWSRSGQPVVGGQKVGEICSDYIESLVTKYNVAVENVKTSYLGLGGLVGDDNLRMRKTSAFFRVWPDFLGTTRWADQHMYGYVWYALSMMRPVPAGTNSAGAATGDEEIRKLMNAGKRNMSFWYTEGPGTRTPQTLDDEFLRKDGIQTW